MTPTTPFCAVAGSSSQSADENTGQALCLDRTPRTTGALTKCATLETSAGGVWASRKHSSGGTAYTRGPWQIIEHKTSGINLYRGETLVSIGFRTIETAKDCVTKMEASA